VRPVDDDGLDDDGLDEVGLDEVGVLADGDELCAG
jgi:hypothetical protein